MVLAHETPLRENSINTIFDPSIGGSAGTNTHGGAIDKPNGMPDRDEWTHTVSTPEGLIDGVTTEDAIVGYTDDIDLTGYHDITWASNVTLVGGFCDPTIDGRGPVISTDYYQQLFVSCYQQAPTLYGVSFRGPNTNYFDPRTNERTNNGTLDPSAWNSAALHCYDDEGQFEVIGCEFWGWTLAGLCIGAKNHLTSADIHRCSFHHNQMETLGYGIEHYNGEMSITKCFFDACRHGVSSFGYPTGSYAIAYCVFGPNEWRGHLQDMHGLANNLDGYHGSVAGGYMNSYRNTYLGWYDAGNRRHPDGYKQEAIAIRGIPDQQSYVDQCHFPNHETVTENDYPNVQGQAIRQETDEWRNFDLRDNKFGDGAFGEGPYGAPIAQHTEEPPEANPTPPTPPNGDNGTGGNDGGSNDSGGGDNNNNDVSNEFNPPNTTDWTQRVVDTFDGDSLNTDIWSKDFGWGENSSYTRGTCRDENVRVENGHLYLTLSDNPSDNSSGNEELWLGVVNTQDKVTIGPGTYVECTMQAVGADGSNTAFWAKPNSEAWPPEIDFVEIPDRDGSPDHSIHTAHWSETVGDGSTHQQEGRSWSGDSDDNLANSFHTYGCEWQDEYITWYVDGEEVWTLDEPQDMEDINDGLPYYMMISCVSGYTHWLPNPSMDGWPKSAIVDSFAVYDYTPRDNGDTGGNGGGNNDGGNDGGNNDGGGNGGGTDHTGHDEIQAQIDELTAEITAIHATIDDLQHEIASLNDDVSTINSQLNVINALTARVRSIEETMQNATIDVNFNQE